jgi:hypothetical protein
MLPHTPELTHGANVPLATPAPTFSRSGLSASLRSAKEPHARRVDREPVPTLIFAPLPSHLVEDDSRNWCRVRLSIIPNMGMLTHISLLSTASITDPDGLAAEPDNASLCER